MLLPCTEGGFCALWINLGSNITEATGLNLAIAGYHYQDYDLERPIQRPQKA